MNPLDNLHDIAEPVTVSAWPLAWGWWLVISLVLFICVIAIVVIAKRIQFNQIRQQTIKTLRSLNEQEQLNIENANALIKRMFIGYGQRTHVSALHGEKWVAYLKQSLKSSKHDQAWVDELSMFADTHYKQAEQPQAKQIEKLSLLWLNAVDMKAFKKMPSVEV